MPQLKWIQKDVRKATDLPLNGKNWLSLQPRRGAGKGLKECAELLDSLDGSELSVVQDALEKYFIEIPSAWYRKRKYTERAVLGCRYLGLSAPLILGNWQEGETRPMRSVCIDEKHFQLLSVSITSNGTLQVEATVATIDGIEISFPVHPEVRKQIEPVWKRLLASLKRESAKP
jgi:hypothetical protein